MNGVVGNYRMDDEGVIMRYFNPLEIPRAEDDFSFYNPTSLYPTQTFLLTPHGSPAALVTFFLRPSSVVDDRHTRTRVPVFLRGEARLLFSPSVARSFRLDFVAGNSNHCCLFGITLLSSPELLPSHSIAEGEELLRFTLTEMFENPPSQPSTLAQLSMSAHPSTSISIEDRVARLEESLAQTRQHISDGFRTLRAEMIFGFTCFREEILRALHALERPLSPPPADDPPN
ncbi:uncharacterized protein LOC121979493 [Zingiber officinale]|uniref:uncharacterized protein LOC121979493 n=1 Tax=Zingiber officinale TaxID=94328 RepID=UPI001C4B49C2|nr:uncharacterized protein LOC121979493 [Zingiber officinale]